MPRGRRFRDRGTRGGGSMSKPSANQIWIDLRCDEGRVQVGIDISFLAEDERKWLFGVLDSAREGHQINFGASEQHGTAVLQFVIAEAQTSNIAPQENAAFQ